MEMLTKICCKSLGTYHHHQQVWPSRQACWSRLPTGLKEGPSFSDAFSTVCRRRLHRTRALSSQAGGQGAPVRAVPVQVAHELLNAGHRYLDVRTAEEFASGHIDGAVNVPYMHKAGVGMTKNLKFLDDVSEKFTKDDEIVVGCQMGKRSHMAAEELVAAGFTGITDMAGGYTGWLQSGKPNKISH